MNDTPILVYYDFVDPLSWWVFEELEAAPDSIRSRVRWHGFELRPPPVPMTDRDDPDIADRWRSLHGLMNDTEASTVATVPAAPPHLVPWTRKAHELVLHAETLDLADATRERIFRAYVCEGVDIGRIDRLVELAAALGMDRSNTKAVLDVDRFDEAVATGRAEAIARGISSCPVVEVDGERRTGFHDRALLRTFLGT